MEGTDTERGQKTYYKYMVHGDDEDPPTFTYDQILKKRGGMMNFIGVGGGTGSKIRATQKSKQLQHFKRSGNDIITGLSKR